MGLIEIDGAKALALLAEAVEAKGEDYVYEEALGGPACTYERHDRPSCLVGHALHLAGVTIDTLKGMDTGDWDNGLGDTSIVPILKVSGDVFGFSTDGDAEEAFRTAQFVQDMGSTWGSALESAREAVESRTR